VSGCEIAPLVARASALLASIDVVGVTECIEELLEAIDERSPSLDLTCLDFWTPLVSSPQTSTPHTPHGAHLSHPTRSHHFRIGLEHTESLDERARRHAADASQRVAHVGCRPCLGLYMCARPRL
jgi:hypothetical protein